MEDPIPPPYTKFFDEPPPHQRRIIQLLTLHTEQMKILSGKIDLLTELVQNLIASKNLGWLAFLTLIYQFRA